MSEMIPEKYYQMYKDEMLSHDETKKQLRAKESANNIMFARCVDLQEDLKIAQELVDGVLYKSVDKYLQREQNAV